MYNKKTMYNKTESLTPCNKFSPKYFGSEKKTTKKNIMLSGIL